MAQADPQLHTGHRLALLEGSQPYFAALIAAMDAAQREVWLETYIFDLTGSGTAVAEALARAAQRGVHVRLVVDGVGTGHLPDAWQARFNAAGVQWRVFSPVGRLGLLLPRQWRRLHRKLCVVDGVVAFCGGINVLDDFHDPNHGTLAAPRFDFAVQVTGPLVSDVHATMQQLWFQLQGLRNIRQRDFKGAVRSFRAAKLSVEPKSAAKNRAESPGNSRAALVLRDNFRNRTRIERAYRKAIASAHSDIVIANAYFLPGSKLRRALEMAARRGVKVQLLLQEQVRVLHAVPRGAPRDDALLEAAGVEIYEYEESFLHAKVAVVDDIWATVGSSNMDPSTCVAREATWPIDDARLDSGRSPAAGHGPRRLASRRRLGQGPGCSVQEGWRWWW